MTSILDTFKADVEKAQTIEEGFAAYVRGFVDRPRQAFRSGDLNQANATVDEALNRHAEFAAALTANTTAAAAVAPAEPDEREREDYEHGGTGA